MILAALYDPETGFITSTVGAQTADDLADMLPEGAAWVEIEDRSIVRTHRVAGGELVPLVADLAALRAREIARVELLAADSRARFISPATAAAGVYTAKRDEARDWLAADEPEDLADWPLLAAEVGLTAPTAWQLAQLWLGMAAVWQATAATIEAARLGAKAAIAAAGTEQEIRAAVAELESALAAL